ncbi:MAG: serine hydrolase domain-containing protein [Acidimicrobiia bacterium]
MADDVRPFVMGAKFERRGHDMTLEALEGRLQGQAHGQLGDVVERLDTLLLIDPDLSFQVAAYSGGELVLDAWGGPHLAGDSLIVPFSVSKNTIGFTMALLVQRGLLDLDVPVSHYWPEFVGGGKEAATVRQLLSHQVGLPEAVPTLRWDEMLAHHRAAERLAATVPWWRPGSAFGYHAATIGNLADELVYRVTGRSIHEFYEQEIRSVIGAEFHLGLPGNLDLRLARTLPMIPPLAEPAPPPFHPLRTVVLGPRQDDPIDLANDERSWRFGHPAVSATASARGIAMLFAGMVTGIDGRAPLLDSTTVATVGQQQVRGYDEVLDLPDRAHAIVFQKPSAQLAWGGARSFGHDGAAGALGCVDPDTGIAFGYTMARGVWPGGADPRAVRVARELGRLV